jgi:hypothetical protein
MTRLPDTYDAYRRASPPDDEPQDVWTRFDDRLLAEAIAETKRLTEAK